MTSKNFWNYRVSRRRKRDNYLRQLVGDHEVSFVNQLETKMELSRKEVDKLIGTNQNYAHQPA